MQEHASLSGSEEEAVQIETLDVGIFLEQVKTVICGHFSTMFEFTKVRKVCI